MRVFGLIGYPLKHSFSQRFFTEKFAAEDIDARYLNFEIDDISVLPQIVKDNADLCGLNVTIPYKEKVIQYLNGLDVEAEKIGAVNVIKIERDGSDIKLTGYNSDFIGFRKPLEQLINPGVHHKALILGTGGASKAVYHGLKSLGIEPRFVSRTPKSGSYTYNDLDKDIIEGFKVIVNASPVGTFPNVDEAPDIPYRYITDQHLLYDLVYNPAETKFLRQGREHGASIKNGADMLEIQAIEAWRIWNS